MNDFFALRNQVSSLIQMCASCASARQPFVIFRTRSSTLGGRHLCCMIYLQGQSGGNFQLSTSPSLIKINANYSLQESSQEVSGNLSEQRQKSSQALLRNEASAAPQAYHHAGAQNQEYVAPRTSPTNQCSSQLMYQSPEANQVICSAWTFYSACVGINI